jgi:hypothetical protein
VAPHQGSRVGAGPWEPNSEVAPAKSFCKEVLAAGGLAVDFKPDATRPYPVGNINDLRTLPSISTSTILFDSTYGSGSAIRAAESLGAKPGPLGIGLSIFDKYVAQWTVWLFTVKNLAGLMRLARKLLFFPPPPSGVFRGTRIGSTARQ